MPKVGTQKFPYTTAGKAAAMVAGKKAKDKKARDADRKRSRRTGAR